MANLTHPELKEITNPVLPIASLENLKTMREDLCASNKEFSLQSHQVFLRRVLSPDSPVRNLLMVHGTGVGKTCSAIQIAEEYILRPEYQDKKVLVIANPAVQANFHTEIFDIDRVKMDAGILSSPQCTGRRYLDVLLRADSDPDDWRGNRAGLAKLATTVIDEFYEFMGYISLGKYIKDHANDEEWIHRTFDNRLLLIDEAHNIRLSGTEGGKEITQGLELLVKTAKNLVLVLMTATPMYDNFEEIIYFKTLFGWNDRTLAFSKTFKVSDYFDKDAVIRPDTEQEFRDWIQNHVSFVKGENPFTFPFRLPARDVAPKDRTTGFLGNPLSAEDQMKYLWVVASEAQGGQLKALQGEKVDAADEMEKREALMLPTICVLPGNKSFEESFQASGEDQFRYRDPTKPFLGPEGLESVSAKFASVIERIKDSKGVVMVYCNYVKMGARLFAIALEEHGFRSVTGKPLLKTDRPAGESQGNYVLLSSASSVEATEAALRKARGPDNVEGDAIRVIITTPRISEGVNFKYIRQIHILDPWWNMSRIEQVIGRGLRTCSHSALPFEEQNCTVYLHVVRTPDKRECFDEYTYRTKVVEKAVKIARVRTLLAESAMDCPVQTTLNNLDRAWKELPVPQVRSEDNEEVGYPLGKMLAPTFMDDIALACRVKDSQVDKEHVRPFSTYIDTRDEMLNKLSKMFFDKPIWTRENLFQTLKLPHDVIVFTLQNAIRNGFKFKDAFGRPSLLESRGDTYALSPIGYNAKTLVERTTLPPNQKTVGLPSAVDEVVEETAVVDLDQLLTTHDFGIAEIKNQFSDNVLKGFLFDRLPDEQKHAYLRSGKPVMFRDRLVVPGTDILVLGAGKYEPPEEPVGEDRTKVLKWIDTLRANNTRAFATYSENKFKLSKFAIKDDVLERLAGRRDVPLTCGTGAHTKDAMQKLAEFLGTKIPDSALKNKTTWCTYTELLIRKDQESATPKMAWYTPEEIDVLSAKE